MKLLGTKNRTALLFIFTLFSSAIFAEAEAVSRGPIVYPVPEGEMDNRHSYPVQLFKLIIRHSGEKSQMTPLNVEAEQERILLLLERGILDVFWTGTNEYREKDFTPIRIPMFKGLLGYRLVLLHQGDENILSDIRTVDGLKKFSIGQGGGWPEARMYSEAGFVVQTTTTYLGLFNMLEKRRFDLFPRSVIEVWKELESFGDRGIVMDQNVVLRYPLRMYFFVRKDDTELAAIIERGFRSAIASGEYDQLFNKHYREAINKSKLHERTTIDIPDPTLPKIKDEHLRYYYTH